MQSRPEYSVSVT